MLQSVPVRNFFCVFIMSPVQSSDFLFLNPSPHLQDRHCTCKSANPQPKETLTLQHLH